MYRLLEVDEPLQAGDEFYSGAGSHKWEPIKSCYIHKPLESGCWPHRRKISELVDGQKTPTNSAMDAIALWKEWNEQVHTESDYGAFVRKNIQRINAVLAQQHQ